MKSLPRMIVVALAALVAGVQADDSRTLRGHYVLPGEEESEALEAFFSPIGDGLWAVSFHFEFQGQPHTFAGTAKGSLSAGALAGEVKNESGSRTFTFAGEFADGTFEGTSAEVENGYEEPTGTLTLAE